MHDFFSDLKSDCRGKTYLCKLSRERFEKIATFSVNSKNTAYKLGFCDLVVTKGSLVISDIV